MHFATNGCDYAEARFLVNAQLIEKISQAALFLSVDLIIVLVTKPV